MHRLLFLLIPKGFFTFNNLIAGRYQIVVQALNYASYSDRVDIVEKQLTKDGIENFGYFNDNNLSGTGQTDEEKEKDKKKRKGAYVMWSPNSKYFVLCQR